MADNGDVFDTDSHTGSPKAIKKGHVIRLFSSAEEDSSLYFTYSGGQNKLEVNNLHYEVDTAAQIPWYEKLSEFKMPWEVQGSKQKAIQGLNLHVHSGQMLAVIGSSGILILDEPTSGLDSFTAHNLVITLSRLAQGNRLVLLSVHQPRSDIFQLFDLVVLLAAGSPVYCGPAQDMVSYFTSLGHPCPRLCNPSDYYVDLISIDRRSAEREAECLDQARVLAAQFVEKVRGTHDFVWKSQDSASPSPARRSPTRSSSGSAEQVITVSNNKDRLPGPLDQFTILFRRQVYNDYRDLVTLLVHGLESLLMSLLIGFLYYGAGPDKLNTQDTVALLYMIGALTPFAVVLDVIAKCHSERAMLYHELEDGMYSVTSYFFAKIVGELPEHCVFTLVYGVPIYWLAGMNEAVDRFFLNFLLVWLMVYCSRAMALFVAATFPTLQTSAFMGNAFFTVFYLTGGFVISLENLWLVASWLSHASFMRWGFDGMLQVQFEGLQLPVTIGNFTFNVDGIHVVEAMHMNQYPLYSCYLVLIGVCVGFMMLYYLALRYIKQKSSQDW
ncbi:hypothetical protein AALO_G00231590 [Alosa alosa]|uniref:ABC transporter domain-containing protein n=1 Tax=Alosa alosa TaxID=278164 RepID=A0AAV6FU68_9TELE|nr:hypothetical protein AALO_G00231590 [Alosa alosa]